MLKAKIHICFVSAQAAPNLLPALDPQCQKPQNVILLVTGKMASKADAMERVLRTSGIKTSRVLIDDEHDVVRLKNIVLNVASEYEKEQVALNLSGGTKLMALAAYQTVREGGLRWDVFYVDIDTDELIVLTNEPTRFRLEPKIRLPDYLRAYGYDPQPGLRSPDSSKNLDGLLEDLILNVGSLAGPIGELNALAHAAEARESLSIELPPHGGSAGLQSLLQKFSDSDVLAIGGDRIEFRSESDRAFAGGGWIEEYVYREVSRLSQELGVRDKHVNLVVFDASGVKNELDVAFMARNRLHVIECKTARMNGVQASKANDALFKLAEISRRIGGLGTRAMLASYRMLDEHEKRLARALNVELVCGSDLRRLDEKLKVWVTGR
ncbi:MAG: DUF1887 family protein [Steroidobacteraceae bacterium]|nr:DUF1887 family protein [Steroidobacteraceae bacterium]